MSCRAILHTTGKECIPLLLVRSGELTPRQCDHEFNGASGDCPSCKLQISHTDFSAGGSFADAMARLRDRGVGVSYRKFGYGNDGSVEPWRVCYWGHPPGYWNDVPFRDCQNADTDSHRVNLEVIRQRYLEQFRPEDGYEIKVEPRLRKPGEPPRPYSPDLAIYGPKGERMAAVEYQRSYEAFEKFLDRDQLRRSEGWKVVDWWLDNTNQNPEKPRITVYERSQMHRTYLSSISVRHYVCWVDLRTLKLQAEYGRCGNLPPERRARVERHIESAGLRECSTSKIMRDLESGPEWHIVKDYKDPIRPAAGTKLEFLEDLNYSITRERLLALAVINRQDRLAEQDRKHRAYLATKYAEERAAEEKLKQEQHRLQEERRVNLAINRAALEQKRKDSEAEYMLEQMEWSDILFSEPISIRDSPISFAMNLRVGDIIRKGPGHPAQIYKGRTGLGYATDLHEYYSIIGWQVKKVKEDHNEPRV